MNTLKLKVLLIVTNSHLIRCVKRSLLIWISTCLAGCLFIYGFDSLLFPSVYSITLSLIFSSPALLIAILLLYHLPALSKTYIRIALSVAVIILTSGFITAIVSVFFDLSYLEVAQALIPFIPPAFLFFFLITRKQLTKSYPV